MTVTVQTAHVATMEHVWKEMDLEILLASVQMALIRTQPQDIVKVRRQAFILLFMKHATNKSRVFANMYLTLHHPLSMLRRL